MNGLTVNAGDIKVGSKINIADGPGIVMQNQSIDTNGGPISGGAITGSSITEVP